MKKVIYILLTISLLIFLIIEAKETTITNNVKIVANLLNVDFDTVIDMCYDFEFAEIILKR